MYLATSVSIKDISVSAKIIENSEVGPSFSDMLFHFAFERLASLVI